MNWIKQNTKLASILGVMIAGALGLGVWLYLAWSDFSDARTEWETMSNRTTAMENAKIYPSEDHVKELDQGISDYRGKFVTLRNVLLDPKLQQQVKPMSETEFQTKLRERSKAVDQKAKEAGVGLPKGFALGFEEYSDKLPLSAESAAELNVQLDVMERFVNTLINAGIVSLDDLQRTRLPSERQKGPAPVTPATQKKKGAPGAVPVAAADGVLDRYPIKCSFTTDQKPLETVMNDLSDPAKTPDFLAVRLMRVENEKTEAPTKQEVTAPPVDASGGIAPTQGAETAPEPKTTGGIPIVPPKPLPPDARTIMGAENLKAFIETDYIRFKQPPAEPGGSGTPKK